MINMSINGHEKELVDWSPNEIERFYRDGISCLRITINEHDVNIVLATSGCQGGGGGNPRSLTVQEKGVFELWDDKGLKEVGYSLGNLISFLKKIKDYT